MGRRSNSNDLCPLLKKPDEGRADLSGSLLEWAVPSPVVKAEDRVYSAFPMTAKPGKPDKNLAWWQDGSQADRFSGYSKKTDPHALPYAGNDDLR
jgi:hypothetical protein